ncbi:hypothetical protein [Nostoc parmelioides]|uniref:Uncharacterized protein n=1 Tax=Nostoc parmelioides FACHB-3921 TaxID=2692909 RepID=A0ABR8BD03_9NOSO|nr:hypothetical protein [Nostoc parmelioides]MBD2251983.1 hypothetical protein [Nostoc parmelioides FACHB-3921]
MSHSPSWQDSINPQLLQRLARPLVQPGFMDLSLGYQLVRRSHRFTQRLPLLDYVGRQRSPKQQALNTPPIVFATPVVATSSTTDNSNANIQHSLSPSVKELTPKAQSDSLPIVQPTLPAVPAAADGLIQRQIIPGTTNPNGGFQTSDWESATNSSKANIEHSLSSSVKEITPKSQSDSLPIVQPNLAAVPAAADGLIQQQIIPGTTNPNQESQTSDWASATNSSKANIEHSLSPSVKELTPKPQSDSLPIVQPTLPAVPAAPDGLIQRQIIPGTTNSNQESQTSDWESATNSSKANIEHSLSSSVKELTPKPQSDSVPIVQPTLPAVPAAADGLIQRQIIPRTTNPNGGFQKVIAPHSSRATENKSHPAFSSAVSEIPIVKVSSTLSKQSVYKPQASNADASGKLLRNQYSITKQAVPHIPLVVPKQRILEPKKKKSIQHSGSSEVVRVSESMLVQSISSDQENPVLPRRMILAAPLEATLPGVLQTPLVAHSSHTNISQLIAPLNQQRLTVNSSEPSQSLPKVSAAIIPQIVTQSPFPTEANYSSNQKSSSINIDQIADQVERKLMRRLVVERERRGQKR